MSFLRITFAFMLVALLAGCSATPSGTFLVETKGPYLLDTGDVLRVTVYGDSQLSNVYRVDDAGQIALPLVGPVTARGSTTKVTAGRIVAALAKGYMRQPNVAVEVTEYRPFFIQGGVNSGGQFPYVYGMTVRAAVATAGGFKATASQDRVLVYRRQGNEMVKGSVDLDFPIFPGDVIVVADRWP